MVDLLALKVCSLEVIFDPVVSFEDCKAVILQFYESLQVTTHAVPPGHGDSHKGFHHVPAGQSEFSARWFYYYLL